MSTTVDFGNPGLVQAEIMKNRTYLYRDLKIACTYYFPRNDRIFLERSMDVQGRMVTIVSSGTQRRPAADADCISVEKRAVDKIRRADGHNTVPERDDMIPIGFVRGLLIDVEKGVVKEVDIDFTMKKLVKMLHRKDVICSEKYIQGVLYMVVCGYHRVHKPISARWEDGKPFCRGNLYITKANCGTKGGLDDKDFEMLGNRISMVRVLDDTFLNREYSSYTLYGLSETPNPTVWSD